MVDSREQINGELDPKAQDQLAKDLFALYRRDLVVPREVDEAVISMARRRFARKRRTVQVLRWAPAFAAAAAILLVVFVVNPLRRFAQQSVSRSQVTAVTSKDIDRDGRVDILDAFMLARHIEFSTPPKDEWDINHDGAVDRADVDLIAMASVSLDRGVVR